MQAMKAWALVVGLAVPCGAVACDAGRALALASEVREAVVYGELTIKHFHHGVALGRRAVCEVFEGEGGVSEGFCDKAIPEHLVYEREGEAEALSAGVEGLAGELVAVLRELDKECSAAGGGP